MKHIIALAGVVLAMKAFADTHDVVERGRELFRQEEYARAYELFHEAAADFPEEPLLDFNMAATFYKRGDYDAAIERYEKALAAKDLHLEAAAKYNLGNCWFQQALKNRTNLAVAIEQLDRAMRYYRDAMSDLPDAAAARRNLEKAKLLKKMLLDEKKKQEEANKQQQQKQQQDEKKEEKKDGQTDDQQNQGDQQQDQQKQDEQKQPSGGGNKEEEQQAPPPAQEQQKQLTPEEAAQLLNAIRENQQREESEQRRKIRGRYIPVEKDW